MTIIEQIQDQLRELPPDKLGEVLDFVSFLRRQLARPKRRKHASLRTHPAFGSWRHRQIDALSYQRSLRSEWDDRA